jgi:polysaccharide deacetylase 2 family uncharacterized protein YibQ
MNDKKQKLLIIIPAAVLAVALFTVVVLLIVRAAIGGEEGDYSTTAAFIQRRDFLFEEKLRMTARSFGISDDNFITDIDLEELQTIITVRFPRAKLIEEFVMQIFAVVENTEYRITESVHIRRGRTQGRREFVRMVFENRRRPNEKIICEIIITNETTVPGARAAFLIRGLDRLSPEKSLALLQLGQPLSFVLTPWQVNSSVIHSVSPDGEEEERRRREVRDTVPEIFKQLLLPVLIEIPVEDNQTHFERRRYTIAQSDNRRKINERMNMLTRMYPNAVGFFAQTGNLVLNSRPTAQNFFHTIRRRNIMFVDARRTARNSTAREVAREINAPYDTITFWLPSGNERGLSVKEWEGQIIAVAERVAQNRKSVVFVAADDNFAEAFMNVLPQIARRGIRLVPITHL